MFKRLCALLALSLFLVLPAKAEQKVQVGDYAIHYVSFGSTFIPPSIAKTYGINRSRYVGLVNVVVLHTSKGGEGEAVAASIRGNAQNLLGSQKSLKFKEIREGTAIYYIAEVDHRNEETFTFTLDISNGTDLDTNLQFKQKFYVD